MMLRNNGAYNSMIYEIIAANIRSHQIPQQIQNLLKRVQISTKFTFSSNQRGGIHDGLKNLQFLA